MPASQVDLKYRYVKQIVGFASAVNNGDICVCIEAESIDFLITKADIALSLEVLRMYICM